MNNWIREIFDSINDDIRSFKRVFGDVLGLFIYCVNGDKVPKNEMYELSNWILGTTFVEFLRRNSYNGKLVLDYRAYYLMYRILKKYGYREHISDCVKLYMELKEKALKYLNSSVRLG